jgi:hypothetical protein
MLSEAAPKMGVNPWLGLICATYGLGSEPNTSVHQPKTSNHLSGSRSLARFVRFIQRIDCRPMAWVQNPTFVFIMLKLNQQDKIEGKISGCPG